MEYTDAGGARIPKLGLGTSQLTGSACTETIMQALAMGYQHIDTAQRYHNERAIGAGIKASNVSREEIFLTTKLSSSNLKRENVFPSVRESLRRLGVTYVDQLLIHRPHSRVPLPETLDAMSELHHDGLVDHIGVSNFTATQLQEAIRIADIPLATNQLLYHPYIDQSECLKVCVENDMALTAYSPLALGAVVTDTTLARIGHRYDKTPAQVTLRWLLQKDGVIAIPKASSHRHLAENLDIFDFSLTQRDIARINAHTADLRTRTALWLHNTVPSVMRWIAD